MASSSGCTSSLPSTTETAGDSDSESDISDDNVEETPPEQSKTVSLLDRLKAPRASDLARKRKVHSHPPLGKKRSSGRVEAKEPKIKPE